MPTIKIPNPDNVVTLPTDAIESRIIGNCGKIEYDLYDEYAIVSLINMVPGYKNVTQKRTVQIPKQFFVDVYNKYIKPNEEENKNET